MYNVEVFPLAVTHELSDWKEMDERDRKWFSFRDAASAVEEPDLQALIRSFGDGGFRAVVRRGRADGLQRHVRTVFLRLELGAKQPP